MAETIGLLIGAFVAGCLWGSIPLALGVRRGRERLAAWGFLCTLASAFAGGTILALPVALVFATVIAASARTSETPKIKESET
jgi:hypothetical protein